MVSAFLQKRLLPAIGVGTLAIAGVAGFSDRASAVAFTGFGTKSLDGNKCVTTPEKGCFLDDLVKNLGLGLDVTTATPSTNVFGPGSIQGLVKFSIAKFNGNSTFGYYTPVSGPAFTDTILLDQGEVAPGATFSVNVDSQFGFFLNNGQGQTFRSTVDGFGVVADPKVRFLSYSLAGVSGAGNYDFLIAFEDMKNKSDMDFNDFVALIDIDTVDVPEPTAIAGLAAIGGLFTLSRRRKATVG